MNIDTDGIKTALRDKLIQLSELLDLLKGENFNIVIQDVNSVVKEINSLKKQAAAGYKNDPEISAVAKQIDIKFDSIKKGIIAEQAMISAELKKLQNQKKLAIYNV